jgi:hypothetical protein
MGGTSGALYSLMLTVAGTALETETEAVTAKTWAEAWLAGTHGTLHYSQAKLGDRSMVRMCINYYECMNYYHNLKENNEVYM